VGEEAHRRHERWEREIDDYRNRLMESAQATAGQAGSEIRHEARAIISGVGDPSEVLVAIMEEAPSDLVVAWKEAPYSLEELSAELLRLWVKHRGQFNQGGARHDGTGIDFTTTDRKVLDADDPQAVLGTQYPISVQCGEPATHG
jgi:hypothetical protein